VTTDRTKLSYILLVYGDEELMYKTITPLHPKHTQTRETNLLYLINPRIMNLDGYIGAATRDQAPNPYPHNIRECIVYLPDSDDSTSVPSTSQPTHSPVTNSNFQPRPGNSPT
ncbi:hypothetical protein Ciccas_013485, partial [Cichlidogyrus casuarinus]